MTTFYADTSALLKRHVSESGTLEIERLVDFPATIMTSELSRVEMYSALNRLVREGGLRASEYKELSTDIENLFAARYLLVPVTVDIIKIAKGILERHPLRAYDSVHLASAIFANQELVTGGQLGLTFVCSDQRLLAAAAAESLLTFDPSAAA